MNGTLARGIIVAWTLAGVPLAAGPAEAVWHAARVRGGAERTTLVPTTGEADGKSWYRLGPGDALEIAVIGSGEMRIKARPVRDEAGDPGTFRYSVEIGDEPVRRFRRHSSPDATYSVPDGGAVRLDEEDSLALSVPPGARSVRIRMSESDGRSAYVRVLLDPGLSQPRTSTAPRGGLFGNPALGGDAEVGAAGWDSNAYLTPSSADSSVGRAYWPVRLGLDYTPVDDSTFRLRADWSFRGSFYRDSVLRESRHAFELEQRWRPAGRGRGPEWTLEERLRVNDDTFVGRGERDEFETSSGGLPVAFGDRFDSVDFRLRPRAEVPLGRRFTATGEAFLLRRDYRQDFEDLADIYSLDRSEWAGEIGLRWEKGPWQTAVTAGAEIIDYDEKFSRDADGTTVPGAPARYVDRTAGLEARYRTPRGFEVKTGWSVTSRDDRFAGYWDRTENDVEAEIGRRWPRGHRATAWVSRSDTSYDRARVGYVPTGALREKDRTRVGLEGSYRLRPGIDLVLSWMHDDANNNSETFAYERTVVEMGISAGI